MATSYSAEQEKVVLHVFKYKPHQYYEILDCQKTSNEGEIKKSYRKLAIKLHPDKNPHPKSAEAFKIVNKAWEVLSDPSKKTIFDQTGADPDSRYAQASSGAGFGGNAPSPFQGFQGGGRAFDDDIFNLFFGGGPSQTFTFGNNGFQFQSFGGADPFLRQRRPQQPRAAPRRTSGQEPQPTLSENLKQLIPVLLLLFAVVMSAFFSDSDTIPDYSFTKTRAFSTARYTPHYKIPFYVDKSFDRKTLTSRQLKNFDSKVENIYIQEKRSKCSREQVLRNQMMEDAQGWFSTDYEKLRKAQKLPMPNCQALRDLNLI